MAEQEAWPTGDKKERPVRVSPMLMTGVVSARPELIRAAARGEPETVVELYELIAQLVGALHKKTVRLEVMEKQLRTIDEDCASVVFNMGEVTAGLGRLQHFIMRTRTEEDEG